MILAPINGTQEKMFHVKHRFWFHVKQKISRSKDFGRFFVRKSLIFPQKYGSAIKIFAKLSDLLENRKSRRKRKVFYLAFLSKITTF